MPDFRQLLSSPADSYKRPPLLPNGTYHSILGKYRIDESREKKTPFVEFEVKPTGPGDDVAAESLVDAEGQPIDLAKKTLRMTYYLTPDATYRLTDLAKSCGINIAGRSIGEILPELSNQPVLAYIQQVPIQGTTDEFRNEVRKLSGPG